MFVVLAKMLKPGGIRVPPSVRLSLVVFEMDLGWVVCAEDSPGCGPPLAWRGWKGASLPSPTSLCFNRTLPQAQALIWWFQRMGQEYECHVEGRIVLFSFWISQKVLSHPSEQSKDSLFHHFAEDSPLPASLFW